MKKAILVGAVVVLAAGMSFSGLGQGKGYGRGAHNSATPGGILMDGMILESFGGVVESINIGAGQQYPSITVNQGTVLLGPNSYLQSIGLTIAQGDSVQGNAFKDPANAGSMVATSVSINGGEPFQLRNEETGQPLWAGMSGSSRGRGARAGRGQMRGQRAGDSQRRGNCNGSGPSIGEADFASLNGTVTNIDNVGTHPSSFEVGHQTIKTGPYWFWREQNFELSVGEVVNIKAFECQNSDQPDLVPISITKGDETLTLRDETGQPLWQRGSRGGRANRTCIRSAMTPGN